MDGNADFVFAITRAQSASRSSAITGAIFGPPNPSHQASHDGPRSSIPATADLAVPEGRASVTHRDLQSVLVSAGHPCPTSLQVGIDSARGWKTTKIFQWPLLLPAQPSEMPAHRFHIWGKAAPGARWTLAHRAPAWCLVALVSYCSMEDRL